jgi:retron-type reverse transcriptase
MIDPCALFLAWEKFRRGKRHRKDVVRFEWELEQNIFELHRELAGKTYHHGAYSGFYITDPKQRHIHKATVRDRVVHHAVFGALNPIFEPTFINDSYSCRIGKGTHKGVEALTRMMRKVSRNYTHPCFVLKCDIRHFFDSINHDILFGILRKRIIDPDVLRLLETIIRSYISGQLNLFGRGGGSYWKSHVSTFCEHLFECF